MFGVLLAIHVLVTVLLIFIILIQKSEGGSSLFSSGSGTSMFTARGTSNMLTKATWALATIFLLNCILMAHISASRVKSSSTIITGTPHVSRTLSNKAVSDLSDNKEKDSNKKESTNKTKSENNIKNGNADSKVAKEQSNKQEQSSNTQKDNSAAKSKKD